MYIGPTRRNITETLVCDYTLLAIVTGHIGISKYLQNSAFRVGGHVCVCACVYIYSVIAQNCYLFLYSSAMLSSS